jgi:hypothetical protein
MSDRSDENKLVSRFRGFFGIDDCSTIGFGTSSVFVGLVTVSVTGFLLGGFFKTTG